MRILAVSDLHCDLAACEAVVAAAREADLVIGAGDFCQEHKGLDEVMRILAPIESRAVFVPGNHESFAELSEATGARVLHGSALERGGLRLVGLGGGVPSDGEGEWGSWDLTEDEAAAALAPFDRADVLILHTPPRGVADNDRGLSRGSPALHAAIARIQPRLAVCGHIHEAWGQSGVIGATRVQNLGPAMTWFEL